MRLYKTFKSKLLSQKWSVALHSHLFIAATSCIILTLCFGCSAQKPAEDPTLSTPVLSPSDKLMADGRQHYKNGDFNKAIASFKKALDLYRDEQQLDGQFEVHLQLAQVYQAVGQYEKALESVAIAEKFGREIKNNRQIVKALTLSGSIYLGIGSYDKARQRLEQSRTMAENLTDAELKAAVLNNLGNLYTTRGSYNKAFDAYMGAADHLVDSGTSDLRAIALTNAATALMRSGRYKESRLLLIQALEQNRILEDSQNKAFSLINLGLLSQQLAAQLPELQNPLLQLSVQIFIEAATVGEEIDSKRAMSYASGYLGGLYEKEGQFRDAIQLTQAAIFRAQEVNAPEALYRWQWQAGRINSALGNIDEAISQYRSAIYTLQSIQQEKTGCYGHYPSTIRESVTQVSLELVDLLLTRASELQEPERQRPYLIEAREVAEVQKIFELRDYYRDDCVDAARSGTTKLDDISKSAVIVYPIVLKDRTEVLFSLPDGLNRFVTRVDKETLTAEVISFRKLLEKRTTREYLPHAQKLYNWLVRPMETELKANGTDTIVFVPDGPLRTIPMSALHDGSRYLIEKYALAITPGLDLTAPKPMSDEDRQVLIFALTQPVKGFAPLPYIPSELESIQSNYSTTTLINQDFRVANIEQSLRNERYNMLHIASHAQFEKEVEKTFLLAYDDKMTIENLNNYIGLLQFRDEPVELLTLSACETAAGDDKAALGLAGVAIKAGARSALATLWHINDLASSVLVGEFYLKLQDPEMSRAAALQHSQIKLLKDSRFNHPGYWSPFLLISDWL